MSGKLNGKVALITGGNSGIGLATAKEYAAEGARVIITGRSQDALDRAVAEIDGDVYAVQGDVSKLEDLDRLYTEVASRYGKIDVVFANAGIAQMSPLEATTEDFYDQHFDINVKGLFFTVQKSLPHLNDGASIILNSSIVGTKGFGNFSVYSATKAAVRSFARSWATDLASRKIRVNVISPGPIETPIQGKFGLTEDQVQEMNDAMAANVPLARVGQAHEIAAAALFLASDDSSYVNGIELPVDGGMAQV